MSSFVGSARLACLALALVVFIVSLAPVAAVAQSLPPDSAPQTLTDPINPGPSPAEVQAAASTSSVTLSDLDKAKLELERRAQEIAFSSKLTVLSLVAGLGFLIFFSVILFLLRDGLSAEMSRNFIVLVVIITAVLLIVMGYTEQQVAPAFGLLGTILGYVFGRVQGEAQTAEANSNPAPDGTNVNNPAPNPNSPLTGGPTR